MATPNNFLGRFLTVDIGHPMTVDTILMIKKSVQNILALVSNIRDISRIPVFGFGILAPSFQVIQQWKMVTGNFLEIEANLDQLQNPSNLGGKVSIKDYKLIIEETIEVIVTDFEYYANEWKSNTEIKEKFNPRCYWPNKMEITLVTRKGGTLILEILKKFHNYSTKLNKIDIVQISSSENDQQSKSYMNFISHITVQENNNDLDEIFKRWILGNESNRVQLQIALSEASDLLINCELHECLINPGMTTLPNPFSLSAITTAVITQKPIYLTVNENSVIHKMEVIKKIEINHICPSIIFGFPQWIYPKRNCITNWDEFRYNDQLFKALCVQLSTAEIGLIARLKQSSRFSKINPLYFILSDGMKLLMLNIVPPELKLPQLPDRVTAPPAVDDIRQEANSAVQLLLEQIEIQEISPQFMFTGIYEHFAQHLKPDLRKSTGREAKSRYESISKPKSTGRQHCDIPPGEYIPKFLTETKSPTKQSAEKLPKKKTPRKRTEDEPIHPALMSPGTIAKYRKHNTDYYELPEVTEPGVIEPLNINKSPNINNG